MEICRFTPETMTAPYSPALSEMATLMPVGPSIMCKCLQSTPAAANSERSLVPNASGPTAPSILTATPFRAAATAWLPPFPPNFGCQSDPASVSLSFGSLGALTRMS